MLTTFWRKTKQKKFFAMLLALVCACGMMLVSLPIMSLVADASTATTGVNDPVLVMDFANLPEQIVSIHPAGIQTAEHQGETLTYTFSYYYDVEDSVSPFQLTLYCLDGAVPNDLAIRRKPSTARFTVTVAQEWYLPCFGNFTPNAAGNGKLYIWNMKATLSSNPTVNVLDTATLYNTDSWVAQDNNPIAYLENNFSVIPGNTCAPYMLAEEGLMTLRNSPWIRIADVGDGVTTRTYHLSFDYVSNETSMTLFRFVKDGQTMNYGTQGLYQCNLASTTVQHVETTFQANFQTFFGWFENMPATKEIKIWNFVLKDITDAAVYYGGTMGRDVFRGCYVTNDSSVQGIGFSKVANVTVETLPDEYTTPATGQKMMTVNAGTMGSNAFALRSPAASFFSSYVGETISYSFDYYFLSTDNAPGAVAKFQTDTLESKAVSMMLMANQHARVMGSCVIEADTTYNFLINLANYASTDKLYLWNLNISISNTTDRIMMDPYHGGDNGWLQTYQGSYSALSADKISYTALDTSLIETGSKMMNVKLDDLYSVRVGENNGYTYSQALAIHNVTPTKSLPYADIGKTVTFSFDYYIESEIGGMQIKASLSSGSEEYATSAYSQTNLHGKATVSTVLTAEMYKSTTSTADCHPYIVFPADTSGYVHIWNLSVTKSGDTQNLLPYADLYNGMSAARWIDGTNMEVSRSAYTISALSPAYYTDNVVSMSSANGYGLVGQSFSNLEEGATYQFSSDYEYQSVNAFAQTSSSKQMMIIDLSKIDDTSKVLSNHVENLEVGRSITFSFNYYYDVADDTPQFAASIHGNGLIHKYSQYAFDKRKVSSCSISTTTDATYAFARIGNDNGGGKPLPTCNGYLYLWDLSLCYSDTPEENFFVNDGDQYKLCSSRNGGWSAYGWYGADYRILEGRGIVTIGTTDDLPVELGVNKHMVAVSPYRDGGSGGYNGLWFCYPTEGGKTYTFSFDYYVNTNNFTGLGPAGRVLMNNSAYAGGQTNLLRGQVANCTITYTSNATSSENGNRFFGFYSGNVASTDTTTYIYAWNFRLVESSDARNDLLKNDPTTTGNLMGWAPYLSGQKTPVTTVSSNTSITTVIDYDEELFVNQETGAINWSNRLSDGDPVVRVVNRNGSTTLGTVIADVTSTLSATFTATAGDNSIYFDMRTGKGTLCFWNPSLVKVSDRTTQLWRDTGFQNFKNNYETNGYNGATVLKRSDVTTPIDTTACANGSLQFSSGSTAFPGEKVTVTALPKTGYQPAIGSLTYNDGTNTFKIVDRRDKQSASRNTSEIYTFTMPKTGACTINVNFVPAVSVTSPNMASYATAARYNASGVATGLAYMQRVYQTFSDGSNTYMLITCGTLMKAATASSISAIKDGLYSLAEGTAAEASAAFKDPSGIYASLLKNKFSNLACTKLRDICDDYLDYTVCLNGVDRYADTDFIVIPYAYYMNKTTEQAEIFYGAPKIASLNATVAAGSVVAEEDPSVISMNSANYFGPQKSTDEAEATANAFRSFVGKAKNTDLTGMTKKVVYVSQFGTAAYDATTAAAPCSLKTLLDNYGSITEDDYGAILFERGGTYRLAATMYIKSNMIYGSFGSGDRPLITTAADYALPTLWTETAAGSHIWQCAKSVFRVGNIVIDGGKHVGVYKQSLSELKANFDFYSDLENNSLYFYCEQNPGLIFDEMEVCEGINIFVCVSQQNVSFDALAIKYSGLFGIHISSNIGRPSSNISITNCEIAWMGGTPNGAGTRYGNGVEIWNDANHVTVSDCWLYQIYDAALTNQSGSYYEEDNTTLKQNIYSQDYIVFNHNLIEYTTYGIETFQGDSSSGCTGVEYSNNMIRFTGMGFASLRPNPGANSALCLWRDVFRNSDTANPIVISITGNTLDTSNEYLIVSTSDNTETISYSGNTYYQREGELCFRWYSEHTDKWAGIATPFNQTTIRTLTGDEMALATSYLAANQRPSASVQETLHNSLVKMTRGEPLRVGYLGGSITAGYSPDIGMNQSEKRWTSLVTSWLSTTYDTPVVEINAGVGDTGSSWGVVRAQDDVFDAKPDMMFIEFAVNDTIYGYSADASARNIESLISQCYAQNPYMDIVLVHTVTASDYTSSNIYNNYKTAINALAERYDIPVIDIGKAFDDAYGSAFWDTYTTNYATDGVHPTKNVTSAATASSYPSVSGYQMYANVVKAALQNYLDAVTSTEYLVRHPLYTPSRSDLIRGSQVIRSSMICANNTSISTFTSGSSTCGGRTGLGVVVIEPGESLTMTVSGTAIGAIWYYDVNSSSSWYTGDGTVYAMSATVDGNQYTPTTRILTKADPCLIASGLTNGTHTLTLTNTSATATAYLEVIYGIS